MSGSLPPLANIIFIAWNRNISTFVSCSLMNPKAYGFRKEFNYFKRRKPVVLEITGINLERNITFLSGCAARVVVNLFSQTHVWDFCKRAKAELLQFFLLRVKCRFYLVIFSLLTFRFWWLLSNTVPLHIQTLI
jgi:hypothetical protein